MVIQRTCLVEVKSGWQQKGSGVCVEVAKCTLWLCWSVCTLPTTLFDGLYGLLFNNYSIRNLTMAIIVNKYVHNMKIKLWRSMVLSTSNVVANKYEFFKNIVIFMWCMSLCSLHLNSPLYIYLQGVFQKLEQLGYIWILMSLNTVWRMLHHLMYIHEVTESDWWTSISSVVDFGSHISISQFTSGVIIVDFTTGERNNCHSHYSTS